MGFRINPTLSIKAVLSQPTQRRHRKSVCHLTHSSEVRLKNMY